MFDGASNVQLGGKLLKVHYPKLKVMRAVEHTVSLFSNDVSKIPILNQMIYAHKMIYNIFCYGIYHKLHSILKSKSQDFHNRNIGLFSGNDTIMDEYFMGLHRDLRTRKVLQATISSSELLSIPTTTKFTKSVKYIRDEKVMGKVLCTYKDTSSLP